MAVFRQGLTLRPISRAWFDEVIAFLYDQVEASSADRSGITLADGRRDETVRLVKGRHLRAGARYQAEASDDDVAGVAVELGAWDRRGEIRLRVHASDDDVRYTASIEIVNDARGPARARTSGTVRFSGGRVNRLRRVRLKAGADLAGWWERGDGAQPRHTRAPITGEVRHMLVLATAAVDCASANAAPVARWPVQVEVTVRGRWLLRPLAAGVLLFMRPWVNRYLRARCGRFEEAWGIWVADAVGRPVAELILGSGQDSADQRGGWRPRSRSAGELDRLATRYGLLDPTEDPSAE